MAPIKFLCLPSVPLFLLGSTTASDGDNAVTLSLGTAGTCLTEINSARHSAGLADFTQSTVQLPLEYLESNVWNPLCDFILNGKKKPSLNQSDRAAATFAYKRVSDPTKPDCNAIVKHWKDAANNFKGLPPSRTEGMLLYENPDNVSLIALYNSQVGASADCRVATCTGGTTQDPGSVVEQGLAEMTAPNSVKKASALVCMTSPSALNDNEAPFTDYQWTRILSSVNGAGSVAAPSTLAIAAAAILFSQL